MERHRPALRTFTVLVLALGLAMPRVLAQAVQFNTTAITCLENAPIQTFNLSWGIGWPALQQIVIGVSVNPGTVYGGAPNDYITNPAEFASTITLTPAGGSTMTSIATSLRVQPSNDGLIDGNNIITFTILSVPAGFSIGLNAVATLTIVDINAPTTVFNQGDIVIVGVNANNGTCSGITGQDEVSFFSFLDITPNTTIDLTDCGYEYTNAGQWGDSEGAVRMTRTGPTIPAGTVITFRFSNTAGTTNVQSAAPDGFWSCSPYASPFYGAPNQVFSNALNLNVNGDQLFFMQFPGPMAGAWTNPAGGANATYNGTVLYGYSTTGSWLSFQNSTQRSGLPPGMPCFSMGPSSTTDWSKYTGPQTITTQRGWLIRIDDPVNWTSYTSCANYAAGLPNYVSAPVLPITPGGFIPGLWTGAKTNDWFDCRNWDDATVPVATTNVLIDQTSLQSCVVTGGGTAVCDDLTVRTDGISRFLQVNGASTLNAGGTVVVQRTAGAGLMGIDIVGGSTFQCAELSVNGVNLATPDARFMSNATTNTVTVLSDVNIMPGGLLDLSNGVVGSLMNVGGDWNNTAAETNFDELGSTVVMNATGNQGILPAGFTEIFSTLRINKPSGDILLGDPVRVNTNLDLLQGRIFSAPGLTLGPIATATNASDLSFVHGPLQKIGLTDLTYPVGKGNSHRPARLQGLTGTATDAFTVEYFAADPQGTFGNALDVTLDHISSCEYWTIDRTAGSPNATVVLSWDTPESCGVTALPDLRVARWDGALWLDRGNGATTGNTITGTVATAVQQTAFSPWTLASVSALNPLPVELLHFTARPDGDRVRLDWATATERNNAFFTVERSADNHTFGAVIEVDGAGDSQQQLDYSAYDNAPLPGLSYYRLRQTDHDGSSTVSASVAVQFADQVARPVLYTSDGELWLRYSIAAGTWVDVLDASGRVVRSFRTTDAAVMRLPVTDLRPGAYLLRIDGGAEVLRFLR
ncbi:MAG TPA: hypothetical protein PKE21_11705 [Flavobacteriales bacterium]|nr:hypothetical protein [Flavobacteriales bacterium]HMR28136.1 hypothetical protein [Flavobacteriales bacterium]